MPPKVLFVTYGGGHARMITPVMHFLKNDASVRMQALALTTGGPIFKSEGLSFLGYRDFITPQDTLARAWGEKLAATHHTPETGIEEEESIAYLGLSYWDLIQRHGEEEAARLWAEQGRHAFLQLTVFERILDKLKPDLVVTTNSPKSERAATTVAKQKGIATLALIDLFGVHHFHTVGSDHIAVLSDCTIGNMQAKGVNKPREAFHITGNPAFDHAFDYRGPIDIDWRRQHFPSIPADAKILLWADMPAYWNLEKWQLHVRSDAEVIRDLDTMAAAARDNNAHLLIRPHPSQERTLYDSWLAKHRYPYAHYAGRMPLYQQLKSVDVIISHASTVTVEALLMERRVVQLKHYQGTFTDMPLGEWKLAWLAQNNGEISQRVCEALNDDAEALAMQQRVREILPQEKAAPKVAALIKDILAKRA